MNTITGAFAHRLAPLHGETFEAFACQSLQWHDGKARGETA